MYEISGSRFLCERCWNADDHCGALLDQRKIGTGSQSSTADLLLHGIGRDMVNVRLAAHQGFDFMRVDIEAEHLAVVSGEL